MTFHPDYYSGTAGRIIALLAVLPVALFMVSISGCVERIEGSQATESGLLPVIRYTSPGSGISGNPGLLPAGTLGYDVFGSDSDPLLDDSFTNLEPWKAVGVDDSPSLSFQRVSLPECSGGGALRLRQGLPNKGRLLQISLSGPLTVCARMKLPKNASLDAFKSLFCVAELKRRTRLGTRTVTPDQFIGVHYAWHKAAVKGDWIVLYQVFIPKGGTRFLLAGFNASCKGLSRKKEVLVDRVMIRSATVAETASSLLGGPGTESTAGAPPTLSYDAGGELRDSLVTVAPGRLELPLASGGMRRFRFGVSFPAAMSRDHAKTVRLTIRLEADGMESQILHQEAIAIRAPRIACTTWLERAIEIPQMKGEGRVVLNSETLGDGQALVAWGAPTLSSPPPTDAPPNVILVSIDTLRADRLGCYGGYHPEGVSPCIDRIADQSALFENTMAQAPFTLPSHVSMLSGQYPSVHRVFNSSYRIDPDRTPLLAPILAQAGYVTGAYTGGLLVQHTFGFDRGFDTYFEKEPCTGDGMGRVLSWIEANGNLPFFLFFHTYAVHHCAFDDPGYLERFDAGCTSTIHNFSTAPEWLEWLAQTEKHVPADQQCLDNRYAAGIRMSDDALKKILDLLESRNLLDRTLLIITSDHGKELLERGNIQHGHTLYEELVRVPLIIRPPGGILARRIDALVEVLDIPPTILKLVGLPTPGPVQGASLAAFIDPSPGGTRPRSGEDSPSGRKAYAFSEVDSTSNKYAFRTEAWKIIHNPRALELPDGRHGEYELYHLEEDPRESADLAGTHPMFEKLRERMRVFRKNLEAVAESLKGKEGKVGAMDPELLEELRAQGYVK
jgi:arylsulfatase A-like enzyme